MKASGNGAASPIIKLQQEALRYEQEAIEKRWGDYTLKVGISR